MDNNIAAVGRFHCYKGLQVLQEVHLVFSTKTCISVDRQRYGLVGSKLPSIQKLKTCTQFWFHNIIFTHYDKILDWSKLKQFADDNFEFDVNSRTFSKLVENTVGKGEIARHEQFLLFPQCFQKACFPRASKGVIVWEWVKYLSHNLKF